MQAGEEEGWLEFVHLGFTRLANPYDKGTENTAIIRLLGVLRVCLCSFFFFSVLFLFLFISRVRHVTAFGFGEVGVQLFLWWTPLHMPVLCCILSSFSSKLSRSIDVRGNCEK